MTERSSSWLFSWPSALRMAGIICAAVTLLSLLTSGWGSTS